MSRITRNHGTAVNSTDSAGARAALDHRDAS